jgi:hypothetical protein
MTFSLHFSTAVSLEDFLVFLLEMADYIFGASSQMVKLYEALEEARVHGL